MLRSINKPLVVVQKRNFLLTTLSSMILGEEARLADKMDRGELHYASKEEEARVKKETLEANLKNLRNSRPIEPQYEGHIPLWPHERAILFGVSAWNSYFHPEDGMNIVQLGEATAFPPFLENLKTTMLSDTTGRRILRERPNMTSESLDLKYLRSLPDNTVGKTYVKWLDREGVSPDTRAPVRFISDPMHAYIFSRYRQCHDFYHSITGLPIIIEGEIAVKALEATNIGVPMAIFGALFAPLRLKPKQKKRLYDIYLPWALETGLTSKPLINVYWEEILERDVGEIRKELGILPPPDLREMRKKHKKQ